MFLGSTSGRALSWERVRTTGRIAAAWAAIALTVAVPARAAASDEVSTTQTSSEGFSAAAEFIDAQWAGEDYDAINLLASRGVLDGTQCSAGRFCPAEPLTRWVMAVWLSRFLDGEDPGAAPKSNFVDVGPADWWAPHVERLAQPGITKGCAPDRYCPDRFVARAQMASFLSRALGLEAADDPGFEDVGDGVHAASIAAVAAAGIVEECEPGR